MKKVALCHKFVRLQICGIPQRFLISAAPNRNLFFHEKRLWGSGCHGIEAYEELFEAAIGKAESEYMSAHESHEACTALASLRRKHFG